MTHDSTSHSRPRATPADLPAFLVCAAALCGSSLLVLGSSGYAARPGVVAPAVAADLVLGLPLLGYLFLVRTGRVDGLALAPLAVLGMVLSAWWIPQGHLGGTGLALLPVVALETVVAATLFVRGRAVLRAYRAEASRHPYRRDAVRAAVAEVLGRRLAAALLGEVEALVYALTGWRRPRVAARGVAFPGHTRRGYPAVLGALLLAVAAETVVLHLVVARASSVAAWVLTGLSIYSAVWLLGDLFAGRHNPTLLTDGTLHLRTGLRWRVDVPLPRIRAVHTAPPDGGSVDFIFLGPPDLWIECDEPVVVEGPFGLRRRSRHLGIGVDDPAALRAALRDAVPFDH